MGVTNRIAFWMVGLIALFLAVDWLRYDTAMSYFLATKFVDLVDWVEFWR